MRRQAPRRNRSRARAARFRPRSRRRGRLWRWLGLGALGLAAAQLLRGERRVPRPPRPTTDRAEHPLPALTPPAATTVSWVPGPAGSLRVLELNPEGRLPLVFVHGLGGRAEQWSAQLAAVGPGLRAVALDLPGHGGSDPSADGVYSVAASADAIGAVADSLQLRRLVLVGHSLGASAAIEYAGSHPRRVAGLLLVDPSGDQTRLPAAHKRQLREQVQRDPSGELAWQYRQLLLGARSEIADRVLEDLASVPPEPLAALFEDALEHSPLPALERYGGPVRGVFSELNSLPFSLHRLVPGLHASLVPETSHWLMLDRPDELWACLVDFLDELRRAAD